MPKKKRTDSRGKIHAPFTVTQVENLNAYQRVGLMHPFTCGNAGSQHPPLVATSKGWQCPVVDCDYTQNWAHEFMAWYSEQELRNGAYGS